jgi:two-component system KDP operon response regulator KdpE
VSRSNGGLVLIVDADSGIQGRLKRVLRRHQFHVAAVRTGVAAVDTYIRLNPDLVLLDPDLPDRDGSDIMRAIRERAATPIIVLSTRGSEQEKVRALEAGADDYLTKPFGMDELLARIRVAMRHTARRGQDTESAVLLGDLCVDLERRRVIVAGREQRLTPTEHDLMKLFLAYPDKLLTEHRLLEQVWGANEKRQRHSLHVYISRLRQKVETDPGAPRHLTTEPGAGYRFVK